MTKRETVLSILDKNTKQDYIPAGFFIHFDKIYHRGQAAVDKHLEYFRYTGMDFVKIQYENPFFANREIKQPEDWAGIPFHQLDFFEGQLGVVKGLLKAAKKEAVVVMTLYSPFMCAGQITGQKLLQEHIQQNPDKTKKGIEIVTDSLLLFVKECIKLGIDGFYTSTQGGEAERFGGSPLFDECIKPYDLALMDEINRSCIFNILHICDYHYGYNDLSPFLEYPGHIVNCSLTVGSEKMTGAQISQMFNRPFMGGLDRKGVIATGNTADITRTVEGVLHEAPDRFILAADCTLPNDVNWGNIKTAIDIAHQYKARNQVG